MFLAITSQKLLCRGHIDTHGIALSSIRSILPVSDSVRPTRYARAMAKNPDWKEWGVRLRAHIKGRRTKSWTQVAEAMGQAESTVRSWCNGTREINLVDFMRLCHAAEADPQSILFDVRHITDAEKLKIGDAVVSALGPSSLAGQPEQPRPSYMGKSPRAIVAKRDRSP